MILLVSQLHQVRAARRLGGGAFGVGLAPPPVQVGLRDGDLVEISGDGITEGATVVTVGSYGLPKETKIRLLAPATKEAAK